MSLYNMLFGVYPGAPILLKVLDINYNDIPRFRDCFIHDGKIVIHTRTGGGNRPEYEKENNALTKSPYYLFDRDDEYDSTYANFYFKFPEQYTSYLEELAKANSMPMPSEKWQKLFKQMKGEKEDVKPKD